MRYLPVSWVRALAAIALAVCPAEALSMNEVSLAPTTSLVGR
jgi:hypothetical protein